MSDLSTPWVARQIRETRAEMTRPSVLYRPTLTLGSNGKWMATYGDDLYAFGSTPALAMAAFDAAWNRDPDPAFTMPGDPEEYGS